MDMQFIGIVCISFINTWLIVNTIKTRKDIGDIKNLQVETIKQACPEWFEEVVNKGVK